MDTPILTPSACEGTTTLFETEYFDQICAGDTLSVVNRITDLEVRESKALGKMLVMSSESIYTVKDSGKCVAIQRRQWIFH